MDVYMNLNNRFVTHMQDKGKPDDKMKSDDK